MVVKSSVVSCRSVPNFETTFQKDIDKKNVERRLAYRSGVARMLRKFADFNNNNISEVEGGDVEEPKWNRDEAR